MVKTSTRLFHSRSSLHCMHGDSHNDRILWCLRTCHHSCMGWKHRCQPLQRNKLSFSKRLAQIRNICMHFAQQFSTYICKFGLIITRLRVTRKSGYLVQMFQSRSSSLGPGSALGKRRKKSASGGSREVVWQPLLRPPLGQVFTFSPHCGADHFLLWGAGGRHLDFKRATS